jgi:hypothetical protein
MTKFILIAALALVGCREGLSAMDCPDFVDDAVLNKLYDKVPHINGTSVWFSNYDPVEWNQRFKEAKERIDELRKWSSKLSDRCVSAAYGHWLDFYQRGLDEAREELRTQRRRKESVDYDKRERARREAARKQADRVPEPPEHKP